jgi:hypothetical protein
MRYAKNPSVRKIQKNPSIHKIVKKSFLAAENSPGDLAHFPASLEDTPRLKHTALRRWNKTPYFPHRH